MNLRRTTEVPFQKDDTRIHSSRPVVSDREPSYKVLSRSWRNGWLQDGKPEHDCAVHRVKLDHMLYAVCGVCGEVEGHDG